MKPCPPASRSGEAGGQNVPWSYLVKYQYSGYMSNSGLNVTLCSLLRTTRGGELVDLLSD